MVMCIAFSFDLVLLSALNSLALDSLFTRQVQNNVIEKVSTDFARKSPYSTPRKFVFTSFSNSRVSDELKIIQ